MRASQRAAKSYTIWTETSYGEWMYISSHIICLAEIWWYLSLFIEPVEVTMFRTGLKKVDGSPRGISNTSTQWIHMGLSFRASIYQWNWIIWATNLNGGTLQIFPSWDSFCLMLLSYGYSVCLFNRY